MFKNIPAVATGGLQNINSRLISDPDALDFSKYTVKASPVIKVNTNNMSDANKETVGAYTGMVEDGIFVPGEESAEQKAIEEKAVVKQNFIQKLLEHPFISTPHPLSE